MKLKQLKPHSLIQFVSVFTIIFGLVSCNGLSVKNAEVDDLKWLKGQWEGSKNDTKIKTTWKQLSGQSLRGTTHLVNKQDTTGIRALKIETTNGNIILSLQRSAEKPAVGYELAEISPKKAVFNNPEARFPNTISLVKQGENLKSVWSGENKGEETENEYSLTKVDSSD